MFFVHQRRFVLIALFTGVLLAGCSSTNKLYWDTLKLAFFPKEYAFTLDEVRNSKADLLKIVHGERQAVFLALAYIEDKQHKWVSADHVVLTLDSNKIVRTSGLDTDVQYTSNLTDNPLRNTEALLSKNWQYQVDIEAKSYGLPITTRWSEGNAMQVTFYNQSLTVIPVTESIVVEINDPYWTYNSHWDNIYWLDAKTRQVVYSEQLATPYSEPMIMTYVSRIARLIEQAGEGAESL